MNDEKTITLDREYRMGIESFNKFSALQNQVRNSHNQRIIIDCSKTTYISPAFSTLLGSLPHYEGKKVFIKYDKILCKRYITDIGIDKYYTNNGNPHKKAVPFSSADGKIFEDDKGILSIIEDILEHFPYKLTETAWGNLFSLLGEVFNNTKDHSGINKSNKIRIYYCGHWNSNKNTYILSIYDNGNGIQQNVAKYLNENMTDIDALKWAFVDGNSTKNNESMDYPRGVGLTLIEKFIKENRGILYVGSGSAVCSIREGNQTLKPLNHPIKGTIYVLNIPLKGNSDFIL